MKDDDWDAVHDTNLKSVFRLCRAVLRPMMKARHGRIINIGSVVGSAGGPDAPGPSAGSTEIVVWGAAPQDTRTFVDGVLTFLLHGSSGHPTILWLALAGFVQAAEPETATNARTTSTSTIRK